MQFTRAPSWETALLWMPGKDQWPDNELIKRLANALYSVGGCNLTIAVMQLAKSKGEVELKFGTRML